MYLLFLLKRYLLTNSINETRRNYKVKIKTSCLIIGVKVQECDSNDDESRTVAGHIKNFSYQKHWEGVSYT
jgi:hypothetical protein